MIARQRLERLNKHILPGHHTKGDTDISNNSKFSFPLEQQANQDKDMATTQGSEIRCKAAS
jgi:hypothetical protein